MPGQVEDDASVRCGGFGMANLDLLRAVREARPDAFIVYKPGTRTWESGNRRGAILETEARHYADVLLRDFPMGRLLSLVHEVHTLTSQTGFEALLRGVRVFTYGGPFYAGWGLTEDKQSFPRRKARLNLDELVAGALLLYPSYYDWQTENFCRAEDACRRLLQPDGQMRGRVWARLASGRTRLPAEDGTMKTHLFLQGPHGPFFGVLGGAWPVRGIRSSASTAAAATWWTGPGPTPGCSGKSPRSGAHGSPGSWTGNR